MAFNDSLSDMLARIKNAHKANKSFTSCYSSKLNTNVLNVLKDEGYIRDFQNVQIREGINSIKIDVIFLNLNQSKKKRFIVAKDNKKKYILIIFSLKNDNINKKLNMINKLKEYNSNIL